MRTTASRLKLHRLAAGSLGVALLGVIAAAGLRGAGAAVDTAAMPLGIPQDFWEIQIPDDNPQTDPKVALGQDLYFDKRLSVDDTVSCATCHDPKRAFTDNKPVSEGVGGKTGARNAPTVLNAMFNVEQFWDGRSPTLEAQAVQPIINPVEMAMPSHDALVQKLAAIPDYVHRFQDVFGAPLSIEAVGKALAAFERLQLSGDSPFDRFRAGDASAISDSAKRGWDLFQNKARCITCHEFNDTSAFFSDFKYHNIGVGMKHSKNFEALSRQVQSLAESGGLDQKKLDEMALQEGFSELGRFLVTRQVKDIGAFKTSMLRDLELTGPYMHDGSLKTIREVLDFYNKGGEPNPNLDGGIRKLDLTEQELTDLEALLKSLTGSRTRALAEGKLVLGPATASASKP
jgi:cytochrome c peroxidase